MPARQSARDRGTNNVESIEIRRSDGTISRIDIDHGMTSQAQASNAAATVEVQAEIAQALYEISDHLAALLQIVTKADR